MNTETEETMLVDMQTLLWETGIDTVPELTILTNVLIRAFIKKCTPLTAYDLGFDNFKYNETIEFWTDPNVEHLIVHQSNMFKIETYAGFCAVNRKYVKQWGEYVFYSIEAERVEKAISYAFGINVD